MARSSSSEPGLARSLAAAGEIAAARERMRSRLLGRERAVTVALAAAFTGAAVGCAFALPSESSFSPALAVFFVVLYAVVSQVEFEIGPGSAIPTELVLVPMLFVLPPGVVPACVAAGLVLGGVVERMRLRRHGQRLAVLVSSAWHSIGPAIVIAVLAPGPPQWENAPVYALALASQFGLDAAAVTIRHTVGRGVRPRELVFPLAWTMLVDSALAPVALAVAFAAQADAPAVLVVLPVAGLLHLLGTERRRRIDESLVLGRAVEDAAREARADPLTRLGNRLSWQEALDAAATRLAEHGVGSTVILVDLDRLKETNDTHGHDVGDRLIQALAAALAATVRDADVVARIGGDEFAILSAGAGQLRCAELVLRVRSGLSDLTVGELVVSASVGAAACPPCPTVEDAVRVADERLYAEKLAAHRLAPSLPVLEGVDVDVVDVPLAAESDSGEAEVDRRRAAE